MKEWSLISCQVFSNLIRHYDDISSILNSYYSMKGSMLVIFFNKKSKGSTMQINLHSLL